MEIDTGRRSGTTTDEAEEIRRLQAEKQRLLEDNEILPQALIFFTWELDPGHR